MFRAKLLNFAVLIICIYEIDAKLEVFLDDAYFETIDPDYIKDADAYISDESAKENNAVLSMTITKKFPEEAQIHMYILGASMGEYVLPTGMDFQMPLCEAFDDPIIVGPFFASLGLKKEECPIEPGEYGSDGYIPSTDAMPEEFPPNKYKVIFELIGDKKTIASIVFIANVQ